MSSELVPVPRRDLARWIPKAAGLDRQRAVTYDLTNVIHVLLDKHKTEDMAETNILRTLPQGPQYVNVNALDDPVPEPGTDTMMRPAPTPSPSPGVSPTPRPGGVEDIMQWTRQRWIIGNAESKAAVAADQLGVIEESRIEQRGEAIAGVRTNFALIKEFSHLRLA